MVLLLLLLLERSDLLTQHQKRRHLDALLLINVAPLSAFMFLFGTYVTSTSSLVLVSTTLQLDVFQAQLQYVN
jgi:hypothetical protein